MIKRKAVPSLEAIGLGAVVNFFDTLGIGSFATTTAWLKFRKLVPDRLIPPTMIAGLTPPAMTESIIFLILLGVMVDPVLLFGGAIATGLGGLIGAPLVARARVWIVQTTVAVGLLLAAVAFAMTNLHLFPGGGTATGLPLVLTIVAIVASFAFGLLANFGVGNYAPTLVHAEPDGHGSAALLPDHGRRRIADGRGRRASATSRSAQIDLRIVIGLTIGGIPAVLVAALIVKSMPLDLLRWLVFVVVLYAAATMALAAVEGPREHRGRRRDRAGGCVMNDLDALNREFERYDQVRKAHTYRLAEGEGDEFDEDYRDRHARFRAVPARRCERQGEFRRRVRRRAPGDRLRGADRPRGRSRALRRHARRRARPVHLDPARRRRCASAPQRHGSVSQGYFPIEETSEIHPDLVEGWVWCRRAFDIPQQREAPFRRGGFLAARGLRAAIPPAGPGP